MVVNTCAFIEAARQESIDTVLSLSDARRDGARLVVTGCMAERYGDELAEALPEVDLVAPFGASLTGPPASARPPGTGHPGGAGAEPGSEAHRPGPAVIRPVEPAPPGLRPPPGRTSRWPRAATATVASAPSPRSGASSDPVPPSPSWPRWSSSAAPTGGLREVVLVAQDLSSFALDRSTGRPGPQPRRAGGGRQPPIVDLVRGGGRSGSDWTRLLYLYPSTLDDALVEAILATGVPYFDLSLQHVSRPLLKRMRRWGEGDRFLDRIASIRSAEPDGRLPVVVHHGLPGGDRGRPRPAPRVDRRRPSSTGSGFFPFSNEVGTYAADLDGPDRRPDWWPSACASAPSCRTPSPPGGGRS